MSHRSSDHQPAPSSSGKASAVLLGTGTNTDSKVSGSRASKVVEVEHGEKPPTPQLSPPPLPKALQQPQTARALHSNTAETTDELDFRKNDILDIWGDLSKDWWYARRHRGNKFGYVPSNYVLLNNAELAQQPGWMEINRQEADKLLLQPGQPQGVYLLRPCSTGCYALSMHAKKPNYYFVQHFRISINSSGRFCVSPSITFLTMGDLLAHYAEHPDGMQCKLLRPCLLPIPPPARLADLEINRECILLQQKIGHGLFNDVYQAKWNNSIQVAVKTLKPDGSTQQNFIQEASLLLKAYHPHVLQIMGVCTDCEPLYVITELMLNGSLLEYLHKDKGVMLNTEHLVSMMIQLADAMSHLESLRIVHRDLRAANILVGDGTAVKLANFWLARQLDDSGVYICQGEKFPAKWTPAEAVVKARFSTKSDVWSFGVVMWEIVTYGGQPYFGLQNREVIEFVSKGYRMPNPHGGHVHCDQSLYQVMLECWSANPERRPAFGRLKDILKAYIAVQNAAKMHT